MRGAKLRRSDLFPTRGRSDGAKKFLRSWLDKDAAPERGWGLAPLGRGRRTENREPRERGILNRHRERREHKEGIPFHCALFVLCDHSSDSIFASFAWFAVKIPGRQRRLVR